MKTTTNNSYKEIKMKITHKQLRSLIREEMGRSIQEAAIKTELVLNPESGEEELVLNKHFFKIDVPTGDVIITKPDGDRRSWLGPKFVNDERQSFDQIVRPTIDILHAGFAWPPGWQDYAPGA